MPNPIPERQRRRRVWAALSELFLDTELDERNFAEIACVLAESGYTDTELHNILLREVYPVCIPNLRSFAGKWAGFDLDWLEEQIGAETDVSRGKLSPLPWGGRMLREDWNAVLGFMPEARRKVSEAG